MHSVGKNHGSRGMTLHRTRRKACFGCDCILCGTPYMCDAPQPLLAKHGLEPCYYSLPSSTVRIEFMSMSLGNMPRNLDAARLPPLRGSTTLSFCICRGGNSITCHVCSEREQR